MYRTRLLGLALSVLLLLAIASAEPPKEQYLQLPLAFETNQGQTAPEVRYVARGAGFTLFFTDTGVVSGLPARGEPARFVRMEWLGSARRRPFAEGPLAGKVNYLVGTDPREWRSNIPTFARVRYRNVYPGIDLVFYGRQRTLEYDFVVRPGADPRAVTLRFTGAEVALADNGDLILRTPSGELRQHKPVIYQVVDGKRRLIAGAYRVTGDRVAFAVGDYDRARDLVIDPTLAYSTYLGGSGVDDARSVAVDASNRAYVAGVTGSLDFPIKNAYQSTRTTETMAFVTKFWSTGGGLIYSTYFGRASQANAIAVDRNANVYFSGTADPEGTPGRNIGPMGAGVIQAFVAKLSPSGSTLVYSLKFGGTNGAGPSAIALDSSGHAYVAGGTNSGDFPTTAGAFETAGEAGGFVVKVKSDGSGFVYATYFGGFSRAHAAGIAADSSGNAYIAGLAPGSVPTTPGAVQPSKPASIPCDVGDKTCTNSQDAFAAKLNASGSALLYGTYLGGRAPDQARGIAIDSAGNAYVTGHTFSDNFPTTSGAYRRNTPGSSGEAFVTKLNASGSGLVYSTFLGPGAMAMSIAVNSGGSAFVTGGAGTSFPLVNPIRTTGNSFVVKLAANGGSAHWSTRFGGSGADNAQAIRLDGAGNAYVTGYTQSPDFPTTSGAFDRSYNGDQDAFLFKIADDTGDDGGGGGTCSASGGDRTVTICEPPDGATVTTPVRIRAAADPGSSAVQVMQVYVDGVKRFEQSGTTSIDTELALSTGTRRITVQALDSAGAFKSTVFVTVSGPECPPPGPVTRAVTICTPRDGQTYGSPVLVHASASPGSSPIKVMQLYVDGVKRYETPGAELKTTIALSSGEHRITVQALDSEGAFKETIFILVE